MSADYDQFLGLGRTGANIIHIASYEWERVRGWCIGISQELGLSLQVWSASTGILSCDDDGRLETEDDAQTDPIEAILTLRGAEAGVSSYSKISIPTSNHSTTRSHAGSARCAGFLVNHGACLSWPRHYPVCLWN